MALILIRTVDLILYSMFDIEPAFFINLLINNYLILNRTLRIFLH